MTAPGWGGSIGSRCARARRGVRERRFLLRDWWRAFAVVRSNVPTSGRPVHRLLCELRLWTSTLHRDPNVVGRTIRIGRTEATIVGVAERGSPSNNRLL